jgi:hypothetical protein
MRRRKPSCVRRENPIIPASCSHQRLAIAAWTCSGAASASHTLISGKLNELISLFVGDTDTPPRRADQWWIETEPPARPSRFGFFHGTLDPRKNELSCRAALSSSGLVDPAVKLARQVNRGTDRVGFHTYGLCADDLNKSIRLKNGLGDGKCTLMSHCGDHKRHVRRLKSNGRVFPHYSCVPRAGLRRAETTAQAGSRSVQTEATGR